MKRNIHQKMLEWKEDEDRNILLIRGARQVGKTYSIREFGKDFTYFIEVNFEEEPLLCTFFDDSLNPLIIAEKISAFYNVPIISGKTLLFFDEIQACPKALAALRFFHEKMPDLHVVAAGSLLEFALEEIPSFGVGRITSLYMHPMTFIEFILEIEGEGFTNLLLKHDYNKPIDIIFHKKYIAHLLTFLIVGGLPRVVKDYSKNRNLRKSMIILDSMITSIFDDFAKYKKNISSDLLKELLLSVADQNGNKFKFSKIETEGGYKKLKSGLKLLQQAGLLHYTYHSSANGLPLGGEKDNKKFKILLYDTGIYQRLMNLDLSNYIVSSIEEIINKGSLIELFVGLELLHADELYVKGSIFYWHRESKSSNAEVDYLIQKNDIIVPIEVKSGTSGSMKSMYLFLEEKNKNLGIRLSQENVSSYNKIVTLPIYCAGLLKDIEL